MKIKQIKTWEADLGNTRPYTIAFKTIDEVRNAFVEITLENGVTGIGSGSPSEYVTGESYESCIKLLSEENLEFLVNRDIRELNQLTYEVWLQFPDNPAVRAAIDIALYDTFTKYIDVPLVKFLGQKIKVLPTSNTIGIKNVEETVEQADDYIKRGFRILKIKLGKNLEEDVERLVKLREKFGSQIVIRIDANQGYTIEQTIELYNRTVDLNLELIEQPLPAKQVQEMKQLPAFIREKIAADESLISPLDAMELVKPPLAAGIFNIKLMKCGGITPALKIAEIAHASYVHLFWGCNDESIVSISAALHTAFACPHTKYIDLDGSLDLAHDIVKGGFILKDGFMYCTEKSGLGVERV